MGSSGWLDHYQLDPFNLTFAQYHDDIIIDQNPPKKTWKARDYGLRVVGLELPAWKFRVNAIASQNNPWPELFFC